jgi:FkbM family methyltransferase
MSDQANKAAQSLAKMGEDPSFREGMKELIRSYEKNHAQKDFSVRDDITAAVIDALHCGLGELSIDLENGLKFSYLYRSKIAREISMVPEKQISHVWEPQTTKLISLILQLGPGNVIIGGAYSGDHGLIAANELKDSSFEVLAFEPNLDQAAMFQKNCAQNKISNVRIRNMGLWDASNVHLELVGFDSFAHVQECSPDKIGSFETTTIDDSLKREKISPNEFSLIVLDIEGSEKRALEGATSLLGSSSAPDVIFEIHRSYVDWSKGIENTDIANLLSKFGYKLFAVRDYNSNVNMKNRPIELIPLSKTYLEGPPHGFNVYATKNENVLSSSNVRFCENVSPKLLAHKDQNLHGPLN